MRKLLKISLAVIVTALLLSAAHLYITFYTPASRDSGIKIINIQKGASFRVIASDLEAAGVVKDADSLILAARILGAYTRVKAGEYEFTTDMTAMEVLEYLLKGKVKKHLVTIPEGYNIREIAAVLKDAGLVEEAVFVARAADAGVAASFGLEGRTLEGYLFPDTYEFTKGMSADEMIKRMTDKFKAVYSELENDVKKSGMSMKKAVTLASIIEKETGAETERDLISSVFHNRLRKGIRLQSDPTVIYSISGFDGNITKRHLSARTPYNTYVINGLPPGPIANPGKESLRAALNPARTEYLYFVSKNDGTHFFSRSLKEHNKAVHLYQKELRLSKQVKRG